MTSRTLWDAGFRRTLVPSLFVVLVAFLWLPEPAFACSCIPRPIGEALDGVSVVFVGTVVEVESIPLVARSDPWFDTRVVFEVEAVAKGEVTEVFAVTSHHAGPACGLGIPVGARVGLRAVETEHGLIAGSCGLLNPGELLDTFDTYAPSAGGPVELPVITSRWGWVVGGVGGIGLLLGGWLALRRRQAAEGGGL